jgi:hypothetical protein
MAWIKHASSRNRPKMEGLATKLRGSSPRGIFNSAIPVAELASFRLCESSNIKPERKYVLMKTADMMVDLVRTQKHPFRLADMRVSKMQQNRYERRKVREVLRLGDWVADA